MYAYDSIGREYEKRVKEQLCLLIVVFSVFFNLLKQNSEIELLK
ncbi:MAG: hypothetical protein JSC188_000530 [Candidatus Tokpelaia sp. JSC188]|nr:MAG: hypothetical protein JSC188_000530 [Candidatus Tokpelaia sp. JSC188]